MLVLFPLALLALASTAADDYTQGLALLEQGRGSEAVERLKAASAAVPNNAQYAKALGVSLAMQKRYAEAEAPFARACSLASGLVDACYFHARNLYALDRFEASLEVMRRLVTTDSRPWRVWLGIAQAEQGLGHSAEAEQGFRAAIRMHAAAGAGSMASDDPRVHFGSFLFREGRVDEAARVLRQLCEARPDFARGHLELGRVTMQQGRLEEAEAELQRSLDLGEGEQGRILLEKVKARRRGVGGPAPLQERRAL